MDFTRITMDGNSENDFLQHRLHSVARQREELQQVEIDLRARVIAKSEITSMQNSYEAQVKEHADVVIKLQEQLHEKEQTIHDFEKKIEEKNRELLAVKRDSEAAWAKEDLLREQNKELATYRRERDHTEAERLQHIKQIHDLQEHLQDKERQLIEIQDQHRVSQETIMYKDEQLREAQQWITRVQEMEGLQSHTLQAELRDRTEQYNQLWLSWQRQVMDMERFHLHTVQQLQLELAESKERSGSYTGEPHAAQLNSMEASQFGQNDVTQLDANGSKRQAAAVSNGNSDKSSITYSGNVGEHVAGSHLASASFVALPAYLPPGQVPAVHPFILHQQGVVQSLSANVPESHVGSYQPTAVHEWQNASGVSESSQLSNQSQLLNQSGQNTENADLNYDYQITNGQIPQREYMDVHSARQVEPNSVNHSVAPEPQVVESIEKNHSVSSKPEHNLQQISSQFHNSLNLNQQHSAQTMVQQEMSTKSTGYGVDGLGAASDQRNSNFDVSLTPVTVYNESGGKGSADPIISGGQTNVVTAVAKTPEPNLLDERLLLACIVRTIPAGGRIRISSTLPNRLGKMLSPLHWHDYKKKYGKLDDFVASHPEYFVVEGDFIQLREGAQEMIAAAAAVAKITGAAATAPHSSVLSSVAVTPMAHSYRPRSAASSTDGKDMGTVSLDRNPPASPHLSTQNQDLNGLYFGSAGGPNVKILSKSRTPAELNGMGIQSASAPIGNGASLNSSAQGKGFSNGRPVSSSFTGKPLGRMMAGPASGSTSRR